MPSPAHGPHATDVAGRPRPRRRPARASRHAFAAEYEACSPDPNVPAIEENKTNADSSRSSVSSSRFRAPCAFAASACSRSLAVSESSGPGTDTPAACTTTLRGRPSGSEPSSPESCSRSATSHAAIVTCAPSSLSSPRSSLAPGASAPRRLSSSRCSAPSRANERATCAPSPPVPPVTRIVPAGGVHTPPMASRAETRVTRRANTPVPRIASWSSADSSASTLASSVPTRSSSASGRSTRPPQCCGCSSAIVAPNPHT